MIKLNKRFNIDIGCNMEFHDFPFDTQNCQVSFEPWTYTFDELVLQWVPENCSVFHFSEINFINLYFNRLLLVSNFINLRKKFRILKPEKIMKIKMDSIQM